MTDLRIVRIAYVGDSLTRDEAEDKVSEWLDEQELVEAMIDSWDLIKGLRAELAAVRAGLRENGLDRGTILDLIDHALLTQYLDAPNALLYLESEGWTVDVAKAHIDAILAILHKDQERAAYLADPDHAPRYCTRCGKETPRQQLSNKGICQQCGWAAVSQAVENLMNKQGPVYRKWREKMLQAMYHLENELLQESREREPSSLGDMIDHDKAPPCQGDCYDCPEEDCKSRVEPYVPCNIGFDWDVHAGRLERFTEPTDPPDEPEPDIWWCPNCRMHLDGTWARCPTCGTWQPGQEPK